MTSDPSIPPPSSLEDLIFLNAEEESTLAALLDEYLAANTASTRESAIHILSQVIQEMATNGRVGIYFKILGQRSPSKSVFKDELSHVLSNPSNWIHGKTAEPLVCLFAFDSSPSKARTPPYLSRMAAGTFSIVLEDGANSANFPRLASKWAKFLHLEVIRPIDSPDVRLVECTRNGHSYWLAFDIWFSHISLEPQDSKAGESIFAIANELKIDNAT